MTQPILVSWKLLLIALLIVSLMVFSPPPHKKHQNILTGDVEEGFGGGTVAIGSVVSFIIGGGLGGGIGWIFGCNMCGL